MGGTEGPKAVGEGPCTSSGCQNATTQGPNGPVACPTNNPASGALCEFADGFCFQKGARTAVVNGVPTTEWSDANQCFANRYQNGDLDFDGLSYIANSWPNGGRNHPTAFKYARAVPGQRETVSADPVRVRHRRLVRAVQRDHRRGLHRSADRRAVLPVSGRSVRCRGMGGRSTACVWNFGNEPAEHHRELRRGRAVRHAERRPVRRHDHQRGPPNPQFSGRCKI